MSPYQKGRLVNAIAYGLRHQKLSEPERGNYIKEQCALALLEAGEDYSETATLSLAREVGGLLNARKKRPQNPKPKPQTRKEIMEELEDERLANLHQKSFRQMEESGNYTVETPPFDDWVPAECAA